MSFPQYHEQDDDDNDIGVEEKGEDVEYKTKDSIECYTMN